MSRPIALVYAVFLLLTASCADGSPAPPTPSPFPAFEAGGVVDSTTLKGKVMFEYRGGYGCPADEAGLSGWVGWFEGGSAGTEHAAVTYLPEVSDLADSELCHTDMTELGGDRVRLFSSANRPTVDRHFEWMASHGLDGVFLRRAPGDPEDGAAARFRDRVAGNVRAGAEAHGRVFAIIYDLSRAASESVVGDWAYVVEVLGLAASDLYLHHDGHPVLGVDASGLAHDPAGPTRLLELAVKLRRESAGTQEFSLFAVVPAHWQSLEGGWWGDLLQAVEHVSPWSVGEPGSQDGGAGLAILTSGAEEAAAAGVGYVPVVWPGLSGAGGPVLNAVPRDGGAFYWRQVYEAVSAGPDALYVVSFDGMDDGTAMLRLVPRIGGLPVGGGFLSLDVDGYDLPSDWFLRLGGESGRLLRREIPLSPALPIIPAELPDAARNRVEMTFSTTSDRASVEISTLGNVLTVELVGTTGEPTKAGASIDGMTLSQARGDAQVGRRVSMTVEYTVDEATLRGPMELRLEKGSLGSSDLRVVRLTPRGAWVLRLVSHRDTPNLAAGEPLTVVIPWVGE